MKGCPLFTAIQHSTANSNCCKKKDKHTGKKRKEKTFLFADNMTAYVEIKESTMKRVINGFSKIQG